MSVRIRIARTVTFDDSEPQVNVSREDEHEHLRYIEDSFQVKKPITILAVAKEECAKNYSTSTQ
jgi:hypothetical protein